MLVDCLGGINLMKIRPRFVLFFFVLLLLVICVQYIKGHSSVVMEYPAPNSQLETVPTEINITFKEKIKRAQASLEVVDNKGQTVTSNKAQISDDQQKIRLELPTLPDGMYYVHYYVVLFNDGHSVKGSYRFQIDSTLLFKQIGNNNLCIPISYQQETLQLYDLKEKEWFIYLMKVIYYAGLSLIVGWIFWWRIVQGYSTELKKKYISYGIIIQILHLIGLFLMIIMQLNITTIFNNSGNSLINSTFDLMWYVSLVISLIGFVCLFRKKWFDLIWMFLILALNGYSFAFETPSLLIISHSALLFAFSIWAGRLLFILSFWRKHQLFIHSFSSSFSKYSFWCIIVLLITGFFEAIVYLSNTLESLNNWLFYLLCKLLAVIVIIATEKVIRSKL